MYERSWNHEDSNYPKSDEYSLVGEPVIRADGTILAVYESQNGYMKVELQGAPFDSEWQFTPADLSLIGDGNPDRAKLDIARTLYKYDVKTGEGGEDIFVDIID